MIGIGLKFLKRITLKISAYLILGLFFMACNSTGNSDKKNNLQQSLNTINQDDMIEPLSDLQIAYKIPSPIEMFVFLEANDALFVSDILHNPAKHLEYLSRQSQALNFGIYAADLAYASVFGDIQETLLYFNAAKILASNLGLHEGFGQQMALRIDQNLNSIDSLIEISADSYNEATLFMESQGLNTLMGFILAGGWIESLYIAINSLPKADINNPIIERIVDQQLLLDNLLAQLQKENHDKTVQDLIEKLEELREIYDALYFNDESLLISNAQYIQLANKVSDIRVSFIN
jgi:hypothetical protein